MMTLLADAASIRIALLVIAIPLLIYALIGLDSSIGDDEDRPDVDSRREKRRVKREKSDAVFDLDAEDGGYTPGNAQLVDISVWGACISSVVPLKEGQRIRGRVRSSTEGFLHVSGHVAWLKRKGNTTLYGIAFEKVTRLSA